MDIISYKMGQNSVPEQKPEEAKLVNIYSNGRTTVTPQSGYALSKVDVQVSVPNPSTGVLNITENGFYDTMTKAGVIVNVPQGITPLAKTVTFKNGADNYQVVTVTDGQTVAQPPTNPTSTSGLFNSWRKNGASVSFPYTPIGNDTLDALFSNVTADTFYTHYNVDRAIYPYFIVVRTMRWYGIFFYTTYHYEGNYATVISSDSYFKSKSGSQIYTSLEDITNELFNVVSPTSLSVNYSRISIYSDDSVITNITDSQLKVTDTLYIVS